MTLRNLTNAVAGCAVIVAATACNGVFDGIYDEPDETIVTRQGQLVINATSWHDWYYIDFDSLAQLANDGDSAGLVKMQTEFTAYPIPTTLTGEQADSTTGMYTYWFDVWGQGLDNNEKREFTPTDPQPEPDHWSIAVHRNNVRTNGGAVLETNYSSMDELPTSSVEFTGATFTEDEWSENTVWADESRMLLSLIGCQGIKVNKVLSSWLTVAIPPMPPAFSGNTHVFLIRFPNGKLAAVQLENYMNSAGTKCWLTINYKYPY